MDSYEQAIRRSEKWNVVRQWLAVWVLTIDVTIFAKNHEIRRRVASFPDAPHQPLLDGGRRHPRAHLARADAASSKVCGGERNAGTAAPRRRIFIATAAAAAVSTLQALCRDGQSRTRKRNRIEVTDRCGPPSSVDFKRLWLWLD